MLHNTASGALEAYNQALGAAIATAIRALLEEKHLYQSVTIDDDAVRKAFLARVETGMQSHLAKTGDLSHGASDSGWIMTGDDVSVTVAGHPIFLGIIYLTPSLLWRTVKP